MSTAAPSMPSPWGWIEALSGIGAQREEAGLPWIRNAKKGRHERPRHVATGHLPSRLLGPRGPELTCGACFEHLDRYVELELAGADADAAVPVCERTWRAAPHAMGTTTASPRWSAQSLSLADVERRPLTG
jgi:hypothetical protein